MRKAIFIFIAIVLVAASIDWIRSCSGLKSHKEVFGRELTYADMYEYKDADYDYVVRVPSFFTAQPDSLQDEKGRMRFEYGDQWITVVIESHVMHNNGQSLKDGMDAGTSIESHRQQTWQQLFHPLWSAVRKRQSYRRLQLLFEGHDQSQTLVCLYDGLSRRLQGHPSPSVQGNR